MSKCRPSRKLTRSETMARIRSRDMKPELALRHALWAAGFRGYRKNLRGVPGTPDVAFTKRKVAVFVDGDFWHGRDWASARSRLEHGSNPVFWISKIERNMERDREVDAKLRSFGWTVVRLWGSDVLSDPEGCVRTVARYLPTPPVSDG